MAVMGTINLYVDRELVDLAKAKGINISQEFNNHLKMIMEIENSGETIEEQITKLKKQKQEFDINIENKIKTLQLTERKKKEETKKEKHEIDKKEKKIKEVDNLLKQAKNMGITYEKSEDKSQNTEN